MKSDMLVMKLLLLTTRCCYYYYHYHYYYRYCYHYYYYFWLGITGLFSIITLGQAGSPYRCSK